MWWWLACITDDGLQRDPGPSSPEAQLSPEQVTGAMRGPATPGQPGAPEGAPPDQGGGRPDEAPATPAHAADVTAWLVRPDQPSSLLIDGAASRWWSRRDGAQSAGPAIHGPADLGPDGRVWVVDGARLFVGEAATPLRDAKQAVPPGVFAVRANDDKLALLGDATTLIDLSTGARRTLPALVVGGWVGDRFHGVGADGVASSWNLRRRAEDPPEPLGKLPVAPNRDQWSVLPDGGWLQREGATATIYPPAALNDPVVKPTILQFAAPVSGVASLGRDRIVAWTGSDLYLFERGRAVPLAGDLAAPSPDLLSALAP
jgi:hypothetical protein